MCKLFKDDLTEQKEIAIRQTHLLLDQKQHTHTKKDKFGWKRVSFAIQSSFDHTLSTCQSAPYLGIP
jgi:hypothetical protein